jgi:anionic cell wall polymer biosynthesis LytR-Cps2A-Psr (LCP) family protein
VARGEARQERHTPEIPRGHATTTLGSVTTTQARARLGRSVRVLVAVTASLSLFVGIATAVATVRWVQLRRIGISDDFHRADPSGSPTPAPAGPCADQACNYLVLGSDSRTGLSPDEYGTNDDIGGTSRADTIMLVHTDPRLRKAIVVSFPRDLWVEIPGEGHDRINTAFEGGVEHGGPQLTAQTVANLTGLPIHHYLYVDLNGFRNIVDTLGGVDMCIPAYNVNTPGWLPATAPDGRQTQVYVGDIGRIADPNAGLNIEPGCQRLDGKQALAYVRARHLPCDHIPDFARIGRQQQFLRAVVNQMLKPSMVVKAPSYVSPVLQGLRRDAGFLPSELVYLVGQLRGLSTGAVDFRVVPSVAAREGEKAVLKMVPAATKIFEAIRKGRPIGTIGTRLQSTPPSEANTTVAVIDARSGGKALQVEDMLGDAGFDISPGIQGAEKEPADVGGAAILFRPGGDAYAKVVSSYLPNLPLIESDVLRGAHVAIVVPASYVPSPPDQGGAGGSEAECPPSAG